MNGLNNDSASLLDTVLASASTDLSLVYILHFWLLLANVFATVEVYFLRNNLVNDIPIFIQQSSYMRSYYHSISFSAHTDMIEVFTY